MPFVRLGQAISITAFLVGISLIEIAVMTAQSHYF
jgi:hypothetical protein